MVGAETTYYPGGSQTRASMGSVAGIDPASMDLLNRVLQKRLQGALAEPSPGAVVRSRSPLGASEGFAPAARAHESVRERPGPAQPRVQWDWATLQGAATRPVGLGAQMIPGMGIDPRLLPPEMRPNAAQVSYSPSVNARAETDARDELAWQDTIRRDRARTGPDTAAMMAARRRALLELYGPNAAGLA